LNDPRRRIDMASLAASPTQTLSLQKSQVTQSLDVELRQVLLAVLLDIGLF
jgi:hypothetical protein